MNLDFEIVQLRHAYYHLKSDRVVNQEEFAEGLLAPIIRRLERINDERNYDAKASQV